MIRYAIRFFFALTLGVFILGVTATTACATVTLSHEHPATIVVADDASQATRNAAKLLQAISLKTFGGAWPVVIESKVDAATGPQIHVGHTKQAITLIANDLQNKGPDAIAIVAKDNLLILAGNTPFADSSAVHTFARKYLGVDWYMPGELWAVFPRHEKLTVPDTRDFFAPSFVSRQASGLNDRTNLQSNALWYEHQRANPRYRFHHSAAAMFPPTQYAATPEVYSLVDGKRRVPGKGSLEGWQVCMTNPLVVEAYIKAGQALANAGPDAPLSITVSPNDGREFCQCENCAAFLKPRDADGSHSQADEHADEYSATALVFQLVNKVAKALQETAPNLLVGIMSYSDYRMPSPGLHVEPNVVLYLVGYRVSPYVNDPTKPAGYDPRIEAWKNAGVKHFGIYEWHHGSVYNVPPLYMHNLADALKYAAANGADGLYTESYPSWGLQGPAHWVVSRLAWDIDQNVDALLDQYCNALFGPAAAHMRSYFDLCEKQWVATKVSWSSADQYKAYPPEVHKRLQQMLDNAAIAVKADALQSERVMFFNKAFGFASRMCTTYEQGQTASTLIANGDRMGALMALADPSADSDPIAYMAAVCDPIPLLMYNKSSNLTPYVLSAIKSKLEAKIQLAAPVLSASGKAMLDAGEPSHAAYQSYVARQMNQLLDGKASAEQTQSAIDAIKEYAAKAVFAPRVTTPPVIDGDVNDDIWQALPQTSGFFAYGGGVPAAFDTRFKVLAHQNRIYLAVTCYQGMTNPKAGGTIRDSNIWLDDAVEIFINQSGETNPEHFVQVIANINGVLFDWYKKNTQWNPDIQVATRRYDDHWTLEIAIPLSDTGMAPDQIHGLRFNVVRDVWGPDPGIPAQISAWFPTTFGHSNPELRGWLFFTHPNNSAPRN